ncbi:hypothetical protein FTUN_5986 [Frigoriglobus tundricola]|uniref:Uncharacterized protein n=1 Tax=Frigoriglobus tundricola TaxID=2774151 RepID=A0A6M5YY93_9BACT|nr:hypothetical protein FTUN_5986 [Frigoriglobus tundricola]
MSILQVVVLVVGLLDRDPFAFRPIEKSAAATIELKGFPD